MSNDNEETVRVYSSGSATYVRGGWSGYYRVYTGRIPVCEMGRGRAALTRPRDGTRYPYHYAYARKDGSFAGEENLGVCLDCYRKDQDQ